MRDDFAVFILTHGRAGNIKTLKALEDGRYSGKYYIVIDNEDDQAERYYELYGDKVVMFDKLAISKRFDTADTFQDRRTIVYARNACFDIAESLGIKYFLELDDDYTGFFYRWPKGKSLVSQKCLQLDALFEQMIKWLDDTGALTVAFAQAGDFIGGLAGGNYHKKVLRKAMNTFFCKTENRFDFVGRINEDVNTYTTLGNTGKLIMTMTDVAIVQMQTQKNKGGMSTVYLDSGTYLKSFYTVMFSPQCTTVHMMGDKHMRMHHRVDWDRCAPKIINERYKKGATK